MIATANHLPHTPTRPNPQSVPLVIGQFNEMIDAHYGIVGSTAGSTYYVRTYLCITYVYLYIYVSISINV